MKKIGFTMLLTLFAFLYANAQDYNTGIGLRGGLYNGITIKHFLSSNTAFEAILTSRWKGVVATGVFEIHGRVFSAERLNWYAGLGGHVGFWNGEYTNWGDTGKSYTVIGMDGILGLEYNFEQVPINISVDWKPTYNFYGYSGFWVDGGAISIRYIF